MNFTWHRAQTNSWQMEQWVNGVQVWTQETAYVDRFLDFEKGKRFHGARPEEFAEGVAGDPVRVFQRAFDEMPLRVSINLAFGGSPFGRDVDRSLYTSVLRLVRFRVYA